MITATDVDRDGVDFCARTFGARGIHSDTDAAQLELGGDEFDLIWAGSVFTHLDREAWIAFLSVLRDAVAVDGVLVFTAHGPDVARRMRSGERCWETERSSWQPLLADYEENGFGYLDYLSMDGYGTAVVDVAAAHALIELAGLRVVRYISTGWGNHQDVYACVPSTAHEAA